MLAFVFLDMSAVVTVRCQQALYPGFANHIVTRSNNLSMLIDKGFVCLVLKQKETEHLYGDFNLVLF